MFNFKNKIYFTFLIIILFLSFSLPVFGQTLCAHTECQDIYCILMPDDSGTVKDVCTTHYDCGGKGKGVGFYNWNKREYYLTGWISPVEPTAPSPPPGSILFYNFNFKKSSDSLFQQLLGKIIKTTSAVLLPPSLQIGLFEEAIEQGYTYRPHYECDYNLQKCVLVDNCGIDQCSSDSECQTVTPTHKVCSQARCIETTGSGKDECATDKDCLPIQKYSCDQTTGQCYADDSGTYEGLESCKEKCQITPPTTEPPPSTTSTTTPPPPPPPPPESDCVINYFTINDKCNVDGKCSHSQQKTPLTFWVNQSLTGAFSVSNCNYCVVISNDTWGNPTKYYPIDPSVLNYEEKDFKIKTPGTYHFTLKCSKTKSGDSLEKCNEGNDCVVDDISLKEVQIMAIPFWHEIIPVLPGFLRGLFR